MTLNKEQLDKEKKKEKELLDKKNKEDKAPIPVGRKTGGITQESEVASVQDTTKLYNEDAKKMKAYLDKQVKVKFIIPLSEGEKEGSFETWQGNGHKIQIMKGVMVNLPEQVANDLADHYNIKMSESSAKAYEISSDNPQGKKLN